ncbi:hypothetical protein L211DRAFT_850463 [Terfezia boudieri ATCC MYA-4762]|uniref:Uncharacterized protein n=1 Tax=Terfezia boudieri ATCC MYA-4762 TaxID=1051890 RepID=A0A3N4LMJ2_9PEZI|nr:hypothetical protein L211DRAFT_850463 [Terfezia boudieri ATCC MYA-4762]
MRFLLAPLFALVLTSCLSLANPVPNDDDSFQALARDADDTALHAALHAKKEYKHGIFPHDRHALEAVHREHAEEAFQIVRSALIRRQNNSTTTAARHTTATTTKLPTERTTANTNTDTTATTNRDTIKTSTTTTTTTQGSSASETSVTTFTTIRTTTFTNDLGQPSTVTQTDIVIITPTPTGGSQTSKTSSGTPGLQTPGSDAGRVEFCGWVKIGVAVMAGVGGMVM